MYIEDIFEEFYTTAMVCRMPIHRSDQSAMRNFYNLCSANSQLTEKQANFILRLLDKYKEQSKQLQYDYTQHLTTPQWKQPFRVIDESKKVFIETDKEGSHWVCLKFPFQLIKEFEKNVPDNSGAVFHEIWDKERRLRKLPLYDCNIIKIDEFVKKHKFEIDSTFESVVSTIEEIWQDPESITPGCIIENNQVVLKNASESAKVYFNKHANGNIENDLFLAKSMGYLLLCSGNSVIEKICSTEKNCFWASSIEKFIKIADQIDGKTIILLDRTEDQKLWISNFIKEIRKYSKHKTGVKVAFRESNKTNPEFNQWLSDNNLTGDLHDAKYLIFKNKTPKWLHKDTESIKIIATNNTFLPSSIMMRQWYESHPCVIYINDYQPVLVRREDAIVEL